jgi:HK97 family phage major capsid protein
MRAWEEAKRLLDDVAAQRRDLSADEQATYNRLITEVDDLDLEIRERRAADQREDESAALREANAHLFRNDRPAADREQRATEHLRSFLAGDPMAGRTLTVPLAAAAHERQLLRDGASPYEARAMAWDASSGSLTVPTTLARSLYEYLEAGVSMLRAPTTKIRTTSGENMNFPTLASHAIGTQVASQNLAIGGTDPTFANVAVNAYKYGQLVQVASELITDASFDIAAYLGRDMGRTIGRVLDADLVVGTGSGEPRGLMVAAAAAGAGSITTGGSLIPPTVEKFLDCLYGVNDSYRSASSFGWLMKDSTAGTIRKLRDGSGGTVGAFLWQPSPTAGLAGGQPDRWLGYPVWLDPNVAAQGSNARIAAAVDYSAYYVRTVGDVVIERSNDYGFNTDSVWFRAKLRAGGNLLDLNAVNSIVMNV